VPQAVRAVSHYHALIATRSNCSVVPHNGCGQGLASAHVLTACPTAERYRSVLRAPIWKQRNEGYFSTIAIEAFDNRKRIGAMGFLVDCLDDQVLSVSQSNRQCVEEHIFGNLAGMVPVSTDD
jgi:hypothetical protein